MQPQTHNDMAFDLSCQPAFRENSAPANSSRCTRAQQPWCLCVICTVITCSKQSKISLTVCLSQPVCCGIYDMDHQWYHSLMSASFLPQFVCMNAKQPYAFTGTCHAEADSYHL